MKEIQPVELDGHEPTKMVGYELDDELNLYLGILGSKKSPTGPTERTPKPEYLIALATCLGVRW